MKFVRSFGNIHEYVIEENGLRVLLAQQPELNSPVVTLMIRYNVGSRNEGVGFTGSTHILEHLMFKGSKNFDKRSGTKDIWETLKPLGAQMNATTSKDRTNFFETLPLKHLEKALEVEADRMENAFIRNEDLKKELVVVRNEFEIGENNPEEALYKKNWALAFEAHPYHHSTIGHRDDIENVPIERLREFYREYYNPENAVLIVSGNFNRKPVLQMIEKHFSSLTRNKGVKPEHEKRVYTFEDGQQGAKSFVLKKAGASNTIFTLSFKKPRSETKDSILIDLAVSILAEGKKSRFYKRFVQKEKLFTKVDVLNEKVKDTGIVQFYFTLADDKNVNDAEQKIDFFRSQVLDEIRNTDSTLDEKELNVAKQSYLNELNLENFTSSMEMASFLNQHESLGSWTLFLSYKEEIENATVQDLKRVLDTYFQVDYSTAGILIPVDKKVQGKATEDYILKQPEQLLLQKSYLKDKFDFRVPPSKEPITVDPGFIPDIKENVTEKTIEISSSSNQNAEKARIRLLTYNKINGNKIHLIGYFPAGYLSLSAYETNNSQNKNVEKLKMISALLPAFLKRGTKTLNAEQIESELELMDSSISFSSDDYYHYFTVRSKCENFPKTLMMAFSMLYHASFDEKHLDEIKKLTKQQLMNSRQDPRSRAAKIMSRELYEAGHRNRITETGTLLKILPELTVQDFKDYVERYYNLSNEMTLVKVGSRCSAPLDTLVERALKMNKTPLLVEVDQNRFSTNFNQLKSRSDSLKAKNKDMKTVVINIPEKTSTSVRIAQRIDTTFSDKDLVLLTLATYVLGGAFDSRLMQRVRVEKGLTYGIRSHLQNYDYNTKGEFIITTSFAPENVDAGIKETLDVLANWIVNGVTQEELQNAKSYFASEYQVALEQSAAVLGFVIVSLVNEQDINFFSQRIKTIEEATLGQVNKAIQKYIDPTAFVIVKAGTF